MNDKVDTPKQTDYTELKEQLGKIVWPFGYGSVKVQLRGGKPTLVVIEQTIKLD